MVVVDHRVHVPEAAVEGDAVKTVDAVEPDEAHTAMADEVAATETANGEPMATEPVTTEAMTAEPVAAKSAAATAAGVGDLRQRDDDGNQHCKHQIDELTTHDTHSFCRRFSPVAIDVLGSWRSCGGAGRIYRSEFYRRAHQHLVRGTMVSPA
jgi:hypothetical protein